MTTTKITQSELRGMRPINFPWIEHLWRISRVFRFWWQGEVFHTVTHCQLRSEYEYFEDGLWANLEQFRYFSPNTHYFEVYPSERMVDIYLRKGYQ